MQTLGGLVGALSAWEDISWAFQLLHRAAPALGGHVTAVRCSSVMARGSAFSSATAYRMGHNSRARMSMRCIPFRSQSIANGLSTR